MQKIITHIFLFISVLFPAAFVCISCSTIKTERTEAAIGDTIKVEVSTALDPMDPWQLASRPLIHWHRKMAENSDICKSQPVGFELFNSGHCQSDFSQGSYGSVTYGDFDGDSKSDSAGVLRNKKTKNLSLFIWFGDEKEAQSLDHIDLYTPQGVTFNEDSLERFFSKKSNKKRGNFSFGESLEQPVELLFFAGVPSPIFETENNKYKIKRSILFEAAGETYSIRFYIFDRSRKKAIVDSVNLM